MNFKQILDHELFTSFLWTFISTIIFYFLFKDWQWSMIAGLVLGLYAYVYSLYNLFNKESKKALLLSEALSEKCLTLLGIRELYSNDWLQEALNRMVVIERSTIRHQAFLTFARTEINRGINAAEGLLKGKKIDYSGWEKELERQLWLKDIVSNSKTYVKAVTSYDPIYWDNFWNKRGFSDEYTKININVAQSGVLVERIFILPDVILDGQDTDGCDKIRRIVQPMIGKHSNLKISFVSADKIPQAMAQYKRINILIADDLFVGFSENFSNQAKTSGYVAIALPNEVARVKNMFSNLAIDAHPAESYEFMKQS
jgi:hypothetical protein